MTGFSGTHWVEGAESSEPGRSGRDGTTGRSNWWGLWWLRILLLATNWIFASVMLSPEPR